MREYAQNQAATIRRPSVSISVSYIEVPGTKPQVSFSFRNVANAKWTLKKFDPQQVNAGELFGSDENAYLHAPSTAASTWTSKLTVPSPHAFGSSSFDLDVRNSGAYMLEVDADGQHDQELVLITPHATVVKTDRDQALTFTADALTGAAVPNADVSLYVHYHDNKPPSGSPRSQTRQVSRASISRAAASTRSLPGCTRTRLDSFGRGYVGSDYPAEPRVPSRYVLTDRPALQAGRDGGLQGLLALACRRPVGTRVEPQADAVRARSERARPRPPRADDERVRHGDRVDAAARERDARPVHPVRAGERLVAQPVAGHVPRRGVQAAGVHGERHAVGQARARRKGEGEDRGVVLLRRPGRQRAGARARAGALLEPRLRAVARRAGRRGPVRQRRRDNRRYNPYGYYGQLAQHTLQFKTGADGTAEIEIPALDKNVAQGLQGVEYQVQVFVTDASRREVQGQGSVKVARQPFFADLRAGRFLYKPGERVEVKLRAEDANGAPMSPQLYVRLVRVTPQGVSSPIAEQSLKLDGSGKGVVKLDADALGPVRVEARGAQDRTRRCSRRRTSGSPTTPSR